MRGHRIIIPLALPGIIVTSMFTFVFSWNNVIFPLALSKQSTTTLCPIGTISFFASTGVYLGAYRGDCCGGHAAAHDNLSATGALCRPRS